MNEKGPIDETYGVYLERDELEDIYNEWIGHISNDLIPKVKITGIPLDLPQTVLEFISDWVKLRQLRNGSHKNGKYFPVQVLIKFLIEGTEMGLIQSLKK
jgi:hypothetical protein